MDPKRAPYKAFLKLVDITCEQIADKMETIVEKYFRIIRESKHLDVYLIENKYIVSDVTYMGAQECPFQNKEKDNKYYGYEYGASDITITNTENNLTITFNTLLIHMIRCHQFFESPKSSHRLDPQKIIQIFELKTGINYKPTYRHYKCWTHVYTCSHTSFRQYDIEKLQKIALKTYQLCPDITGLLFMQSDWINNVNDYRPYENPHLEYLSHIYEKFDFNWEHFLQDYYINKNKKYASDEYLKKYILTDEQIQQNIKNELEKLEDYKTTGNLDNTELIVIIGSNNIHKEKKFMIDENELAFNNMRFASYRCGNYKEIQFV